ncbi:MAG TPA: bifunctional diaminohydroxyphosphoribosylaminopyrimidine deaminase/5-amino-6-(5-phosphoribosylamino)uracil reductase RibD [Candidatus Binataceae bacterium]|nr:bifunctional diaminohydroxyphosphoribosylaminopyrimidine deaminase/5-amino-6-(5-phosphoribosylamino)uracil reductase RibD [Candidatus Binataceae bacterium]
MARAVPATIADQRFMREALALARAMLGRTSPNPAVGCVIVKAGRIVGRGATAEGGRPHAETIALAEAGRRARDATVYVSLEPCAHQGVTPPCARALIDSGVARVVAGCVDPYRAVRGRGLAMLRRGGVAVTAGVLESECIRLNEGFFTRVRRGRPFATLKLALSLDGRIAAASGDSRWISSDASRDLVHRWRAESDAVIVGAGTVIADNPRLNCRIAGGRDPIRVVIDGQLRCSPEARVFRIRSKASAILVTIPRNLALARARFAGARVEVIACDSQAGAAAEQIDLAVLMREFGRRGFSRVLIEGGAHLAGFALAAGVVDRVAFFLAPIIVGSGIPAVEGIAAARIKDAIRLVAMSPRAVGPDLLIEAGLKPARVRKSRTEAR